MLLDDEEARIMSKAEQSRLRDASYPDHMARQTFDDFFRKRELAGARILELGPGQYDFVRMLIEAGASVLSIDKDPAVIALGKKRGYEVMHAEFLKVDWGALVGQFDGLFCRASINAFWFSDPEPLGRFVDQICSVLKSDGWGWLAPWNGAASGGAPDHIRQMLEAQRRAFERNGFRSYEPTREEVSRYAISVKENSIVFFRNIDSGEY